MIITVDPSQSEDIAAFAMVKQYRMQALNVTLNGGTGVSAWQAVQGGEGYTQTVVTPVTGIELVYEDPNAIVSYTLENDDTSNYDAASDAGIILSSIEPTDNAWTYTCVFHADSAPVSSVDIDLLVYGNVARGTEQSGSSATAEEITAQVLAGLETRVLALENEMPDKADKSTTYTKAQVDTYLAAKANDNAVVHLAGAETIPGRKTFTTTPIMEGDSSLMEALILKNKAIASNTENATTGKNTLLNYLANDNTVLARLRYRTGSGMLRNFNVDLYDNTGSAKTLVLAQIVGNGVITSPMVSDALDSYAPMVRTTGNQTIAGTKAFSLPIIRNTLIPGSVSGYTPSIGLEVRDINSKTLGVMNVSKGAAYITAGIEAKTNINTNHYSKLYIKFNDSGKVELILESLTSQGYEQHVIYSFGS